MQNSHLHHHDYHLTPGVGKAHTYHSSIPHIAHKKMNNVTTPAPHNTVRPSVIRGALDHIQHRPRSKMSYDPMEDFLNERSVTSFDDVSRSIRAHTAALLKQVHAPVPRAIKPLSLINTYNNYAETPISQRITSDEYINHLLRPLPGKMSNGIDITYIPETSKVHIGKTHLACMTFAGDHAIPRRKHLMVSGDEDYRNVRSDVEMMSHYHKMREAAASAPRENGQVHSTETKHEKFMSSTDIRPKEKVGGTSKSTYFKSEEENKENVTVTLKKSPSVVEQPDVTDDGWPTTEDVTIKRPLKTKRSTAKEPSKDEVDNAEQQLEKKVKEEEERKRIQEEEEERKRLEEEEEMKRIEEEEKKKIEEEEKKRIEEEERKRIEEEERKRIEEEERIRIEEEERKRIEEEERIRIEEEERKRIEEEELKKQQELEERLAEEYRKEQERKLEEQRKLQEKLSEERIAAEQKELEERLIRIKEEQDKSMVEEKGIGSYEQNVEVSGNYEHREDGYYEEQQVTVTRRKRVVEGGFDWGSMETEEKHEEKKSQSDSEEEPAVAENLKPKIDITEDPANETDGRRESKSFAGTDRSKESESKELTPSRLEEDKTDNTEMDSEMSESEAEPLVDEPKTPVKEKRKQDSSVSITEISSEEETED